jgi:excinuclease ABC subunit B
MPRFDLVSQFQPTGDQPQAIDSLVEGVREGYKHQTLLGATGTGKTYVVSKLIEEVQKPTLVLAHNKTLAAQLYSEFSDFFPHSAVEYFVSYYDYYQPEAYVPKHDLYIEKDADINEEIDRLRLAATTALFSRRDVIIVASVSCIYAIGDPQEWGRVVVELERGGHHRRDTLLRHLVGIYYERNDVSLERGNFRVRGDTLEIMPAYGETAYRISFWGDEIERITEVDPLTGEVLADLNQLKIFPAKHFITPEEKREKALADIEAELQEQLSELRAEGKLLEAQRLEQRTRYDLEMIREIGYCSGIENYSRHLQQRPPGSPPWTLMDYFPADYLLVVDESHMTIPQVRGMYHGDRSRKQTLVDFGFRLPSALDNRPLDFEEFEARANQTIYTSATPGPYELDQSAQVVEQIIRPTGVVDPKVIVRPARGQVDDLVGRINQRLERGERVLVTTLTKRMAEDLSDYLRELDINVHYLHSEIQTIERVEILRDLRLGAYDVVVGVNLLREGLDLPEVSMVAILDADKEGFLRSDTALIQTIGRAARHVNGTAVLYADRVTDSMARAIDETERRREVQIAYNREHGIKPASIVKEVRDLTDRVRRQAVGALPGEEEADLSLAQLPKDELARMIRELRKQMEHAADELEFEKAALLRDRIFELREVLQEKEAADIPAWERERRRARLGVNEGGDHG